MTIDADIATVRAYAEESCSDPTCRASTCVLTRAAVRLADEVERMQGPRRPSHAGWPDDSGAHPFVADSTQPHRCGVEHPTERDEHGRPTQCLDREAVHWRPSP